MLFHSILAATTLLASALATPISARSSTHQVWHVTNASAHCDPSSNPTCTWSFDIEAAPNHAGVPGFKAHCRRTANAYSAWGECDNDKVTARLTEKHKLDIRRRFTTRKGTTGAYFWGVHKLETVDGVEYDFDIRSDGTYYPIEEGN